MFKQGPIPAFVHGVLEYLIAALLIASSFLLDFEDDTAVAVSIAAGVLVLVITAALVATPPPVEGESLAAQAGSDPVVTSDPGSVP